MAAAASLLRGGVYHRVDVPMEVQHASCVVWPSVIPPDGRDGNRLHRSVRRHVARRAARTERVDFIEPADELLELIGNVDRVAASSFATDQLRPRTPLAVVPAAP